MPFIIGNCLNLILDHLYSLNESPQNSHLFFSETQFTKQTSDKYKLLTWYIAWIIIMHFQQEILG